MKGGGVGAGGQMGNRQSKDRVGAACVVSPSIIVSVMWL